MGTQKVGYNNVLCRTAHRVARRGCLACVVATMVASCPGFPRIVPFVSQMLPCESSQDINNHRSFYYLHNNTQLKAMHLFRVLPTSSIAR